MTLEEAWQIIRHQAQMRKREQAMRRLEIEIARAACGSVPTRPVLRAVRDHSAGTG